MSNIKVAVVGIGNCASSLIQGIEYYRYKEDEEPIGLMHYDLGVISPRILRLWRPLISTNEKWEGMLQRPCLRHLTVRHSFAKISPQLVSGYKWAGLWMVSPNI